MPSKQLPDVTQFADGYLNTLIELTKRVVSKYNKLFFYVSDNGK